MAEKEKAEKEKNKVLCEELEDEYKKKKEENEEKYDYSLYGFKDPKRKEVKAQYRKFRDQLKEEYKKKQKTIPRCRF